MKHALAIVAVLGLLGATALAVPSEARFSVNRDAGLLGHSAENHSNAGGAGNFRVAKGTKTSMQHVGIFDWDKAAVAEWMNAQAVAQGFADLDAAAAAGAVTVRFELAAPTWGGDYPNKIVHIHTVWSDNDWTEGDGPANFANYNWSTPSAATSEYAQDKIPASVGAVPWVDPGTGLPVSVKNVPGLTNSVDMLGLYGTSDPANPVWNSVVLDEAVWRDLILNPLGYNRGLLTSGEWGNNDNAQIYAREQWGGAADPSLLITIVPEPATMLLIAVGGVGLVLRRKR